MRFSAIVRTVAALAAALLTAAAAQAATVYNGDRVGTDAIRERGVDVVSILSYSSECATVAFPYAGDEP